MRTFHGLTRTLAGAAALALALAAPALAAPGGFLGVYLVEEERGRDGALVEEVAPDSPAAQAGLRKGDRIVGVDGAATPNSKALIGILTRANPGQKLSLRVSRDGWERTLDVTLGGREPAARAPAPPAPRPQGESGFLGVFLRQGPQGEAVVDGVRDGSPAAQAGLQSGDVVKTVDGREVRDPSAFVAALSSLPPGHKVKLGIRRGGALGRDITVEATLARRTADVTAPAPRARPSQPEPTPSPEARRPPYIGVALVDADGKGPLKVEDVQAGSPAERFGVRPGDVVLSVDGREVKTIEQFVKAMDGKFAGDAVVLKIERDGWRNDVRVTLAARPE
ncbi:MAG: PDZ domain-containing protein [Planctomycetes bacterium]|nr:PDZ domain-containing protein [Planctomycetota bacterium]